jgi:hypothetical protein
MASPFGEIEKFTPLNVISSLNNVLENLTDSRSGNGVCQKYSMLDAAMSAFLGFFMQSGSFLAYQNTVSRERGRNNARSLFGVHRVPSDNQTRNLLDGVSPDEINPFYRKLLKGLEQIGKLKEFHILNGSVLIALDGIEYFSSQQIYCNNCSHKTLKTGKIQYFHSAITPAIVSPQQSEVVPLVPEFVYPQDGHEKQDCELTAAKRWMNNEAPYLPVNTTILGDDLYCHHPFCEQILEKNWHFILTCKPNSHKTLYEYIEYLEDMGNVESFEKRSWTGKQHITKCYRYVNHVPLRDGDDTLIVNWCELKITDSKGKSVYHNTFATDYTLNEDNVQEIIKAARARWKIENENNNTLKTKGYNFKHNYGHGKQHLSALLASLNILAFLTHTILEWFDKCYQLLRKHLSSRKTFFDDLRALMRYLRFDNWRHLMEFMLQNLGLPIPLYSLFF